MLFNSYIFIFLFLPLALLGWYGLNKLNMYRLAQGYLVGMSLWFYGYFNSAGLSVLLASCLLNYLLSWLIRNEKKEIYRHFILVAGVIVNLGILGYFKYYDFFAENINAVFHADFEMKKIILPLGISFFTFQQLSYLIDRCRGEAKHYRFLDYISFVTFFPSLISGPIVLHAQTVPQFQNREIRTFEVASFSHGMMQFTIGLGKKVLLADTLALAVNYGYSDIAALDSFSALLVAVFYTFELYFDFSGYSDMAIGIAKMFRIDIPQNFNAPYKAESVKDFWKRWHMTLSRFLTTYLYIPLGGNRKGKGRTIVNTLITFLLSGLWHGANWTFVFWGLLHGIGVAWNRLGFVKLKHRRVKQLLTFSYVCFAFIFFRSDTIADGFGLIARIFSFTADGGLIRIAAAMEPSEVFIVTKALSMMAPGLVWIVQVIIMALTAVVCILVLRAKTTETIIKSDMVCTRYIYLLVILFVWSVVSLSGVSTFLYFNF